jgi:hypothetical protein
VSSIWKSRSPLLNRAGGFLFRNQCAVLTRLESEIPVVHHGLIASGSQIERSAETRDALREQRNILCYLKTDIMSLVENFSCLVISAVCDNADSHQNDLWQGYAAVTSAAYAKDLLQLVYRSDLERKDTVVFVAEEK